MELGIISKQTCLQSVCAFYMLIPSHCNRGDVSSVFKMFWGPHLSMWHSSGPLANTSNRQLRQLLVDKSQTVLKLRSQCCEPEQVPGEVTEAFNERTLLSGNTAEGLTNIHRIPQPSLHTQAVIAVMGHHLWITHSQNTMCSEGKLKVYICTL